MKKLICLTSLFIGLFFGHQASATNWLWAGATPWVYNDDDSTWYFMQSIDSAVWILGVNSEELSPPVGNSPASVAGRTFIITVTGEGEATVTFDTNTAYTEVTSDGTSTGSYRYVKTGNDSALIVLLSDDSDGDITSVDATFATTSSGAVNGRSTSINDTETITGTFSVL